MIAAVVLINTERGRIADTAEALLELPEVAEVYSVAGAYDLVAIVRVRAYEQMATLATRAGVEGHAPVVIRTPLIDLTKREIIQLGQRLGVDYALTTSCYDPAPDGAACGHCDACQLRLRGFLEAGTDDPARYQEESEARAAGQTSA